ncbi:MULTISPECIES: hypothetical protein [Marinobacter]|nr:MULTISPECIES: hypothetical protein [Marinobacter]WBU41616.1 hypothetical protein PBN92_01535 [Marinobacter alkaliphilus]
MRCKFRVVPGLSAHVYMATMGTTVTSHIKPMITGYEDLEERH